MDSFERVLTYLVIGLSVISTFFYGVEYTKDSITELDNNIQKELVVLVKKQETLDEKIMKLHSKKDIIELQDFMKEQEELNKKQGVVNTRQTEFNQTVVEAFYGVFSDR